MVMNAALGSSPEVVALAQIKHIIIAVCFPWRAAFANELRVYHEDVQAAVAAVNQITEYVQGVQAAEKAGPAGGGLAKTDEPLRSDAELIAATDRESAALKASLKKLETAADTVAEGMRGDHQSVTVRIKKLHDSILSQRGENTRLAALSREHIATLENENRKLKAENEKHVEKERSLEKALENQEAENEKIKKENEDLHRHAKYLMGKLGEELERTSVADINTRNYNIELKAELKTARGQNEELKIAVENAKKRAAIAKRVAAIERKKVARLEEDEAKLLAELEAHADCPLDAAAAAPAPTPPAASSGSGTSEDEWVTDTSEGSNPRKRARTPTMAIENAKRIKSASASPLPEQEYSAAG